MLVSLFEIHYYRYFSIVYCNSEKSLPTLTRPSSAGNRLTQPTSGQTIYGSNRGKSSSATSRSTPARRKGASAHNARSA